jgi:hypothetical protein
MKKFLFPLLVGVICVFLTSMPLLHRGFYVPHDFTHAARIAEMNRSLLSGEFPVRWSQNFGFGYGMPLFNFYAPLPYYIAQIPYTLTHDAVLSIKFLLILSATLSFVGMYILGKKVWGEDGGLVSAVVFSFASYRALDMYVRGDIGELFAISFLPFALYGLLLFRENAWKGTVLAGIFLCLTLLSHNLSGMIAVAMFGVIGLHMMLTDRRKETTLAVFGSLVLGIALSAFYILPAFFEKNLTRVEQTITTGYFDYHNHFVALRQFLFGTWGYGGSIPGLEDGISFTLGWVPLVLFILGLIAMWLQRKKYKHLPVGFWVWSLLFFMGTLFMASNKSVWIWDRVQLLKFMQFPWRFLEFSHLFLAILAGAVGTWVHQKREIVPLLLAGLIGLFSLTQLSYFKPEKYVEGGDLQATYSTDPLFIRETMSKTLNDYLPPVIHDDALPTPITERLHIEHGDGVLTVLKDTPTKISGKISCNSGCAITVNIFEFPLWTLTLNGDPVVLPGGNPFPISYFSVSSGTYDFSVQLRDTPIRILANLTSLGAWALVLMIYAKYRYNKRF